MQCCPLSKFNSKSHIVHYFGGVLLICFMSFILQELSFKKAVSDEEMPVKMKHVRSLIIGTYTDKNADLFWRNVAACPPINTDVTAWKFCHCLHVLFRDGHPNTLRDSHHHINRIKDTGQHFVSHCLERKR